MLGAIDHDGLDGCAGGFETEAKLLLNGGEEGCDRRIGSSRGDISAELRFVGSPLEIEIVTSGEPGFIDNRTVENRTLHHGYKVGHGGIARGQQDALRVDGANEGRLLGRGSFAGLQF